MPKKTSLAVNKDVPGKPMVTRIVNSEANHKPGKVLATPDMKKKVSSVVPFIQALN